MKQSETARILESGIGGFEQFYEEFCRDFDLEHDYYKVATQLMENLIYRLMEHMNLNPDDIDDDCCVVIQESLSKYAGDSFPNIKSVCERLLEEGY